MMMNVPAPRGSHQGNVNLPLLTPAILSIRWKSRHPPMPMMMTLWQRSLKPSPPKPKRLDQISRSSPMLRYTQTLQCGKLITNYLKIAESLPAKTVPRRSNAAHQTRTKTLSTKQKKRKDRSDSLGSSTAQTAPSGSKKSRVTVEEVEDEEDIGPSQSTPAPPVASSSSTTQIPKV